MSLSKKEIFRLLDRINDRRQREREALEDVKDKTGNRSKKLKGKNIADLSVEQLKSFSSGVEIL